MLFCKWRKMCPQKKRSSVSYFQRLCLFAARLTTDTALFHFWSSFRINPMQPNSNYNIVVLLFTENLPDFALCLHSQELCISAVLILFRSWLKVETYPLITSISLMKIILLEALFHILFLWSLLLWHVIGGNCLAHSCLAEIIWQAWNWEPV